MTKFTRVLLPALLVLAVPAFSAPLLNTAITGTLLFPLYDLTTNWFDPGNGAVPAGSANSGSATVTILSTSVPPDAWAFGFNDGASQINIYFQDDYTFTLSQAPVLDPLWVGPWTIKLSWASPMLGGLLGVVNINNPFVPEVQMTSSDAQNLTLDFAGTGTAPTLTALALLPAGGYSATFIVGGISDVPEPATLGLMFGGLAVLGLVSRKRRG